MSWADQVDAFESLEQLRHPGRVLHIHEKLSSPSRKRSLSEKMRRHEERLAKAKQLRDNLILAKTEKLKDLFKKIEEVRQDKEVLLLKKRDLFTRKMKHAEEKRRQYLQVIVNKAHDEENKAKEIAFINGLEAQNKLHDIMQQHQSHESRLADMAEERTRRQEEKAAKEVAALERRKALEAERQARMAELCEKRRQRCERIDRQQAERREELLEQAREKARDREERLSALQQAQQAKETELVKKIQQKQEESARRHEENIEQIRQRALESSIMKYSRGCDEAPKLVRYETKKLCTLCNSLITSEVYLLSHLRGRRHQEALRLLHQTVDVVVVASEDSETYNLKHIIDAPHYIDDPQVTRDKERHKALKRRCRKIRSRMSNRGKHHNNTHTHIRDSTTNNNNNTHTPTPLIRDSPNKVRISRALHQVGKSVANQGTGPWPSADVAALDRPLLELIRLLDRKDVVGDQMDGSDSHDSTANQREGSDARDSRANQRDGTDRRDNRTNQNNNNRNNQNNNKNNKTKNNNNNNQNNNRTHQEGNQEGHRNDQNLFNAQNGFTKLDSVLRAIVRQQDSARPCDIPAKTLGYCGRVMLAACRGNVHNCRQVLYSNLIGSIVDYLMQRFNDIVDESARVECCSGNTAVGGAGGDNLPSDCAAAALFEVMGEVMEVLCESDLNLPADPNIIDKERADETWIRLQDVVSYCVCIGLVDKVWWYLGLIQGPIQDSNTGVVQLVLAAMRFATALAKPLAARTPADDPTQLVATLHVTDACGVVSLMYGMLLHQGGRSAMPHTPPPPSLTHTTHAITAAATIFLHNLATLDLVMFQSVLGGEGISLEFRHIASYLLWYCSHWSADDILHNIIPLVGFFTINNKENQVVVQSGEVPSVLQQLCNLPWQYFSEPRLTAILFPTLLACCLYNNDNLAILQHEMSFQVLDEFLQSSQAADKPLVRLLRLHGKRLHQGEEEKEKEEK
ncbi:hypothetical protein Pcinc_039763 [Petrolisthes cinctipes]|uniref:U1-type domain-containing protein n=1 Tax=Petrolisthes cinctipes TaxID=88211 RepID=A0AAE1EIS1_PETCI|nr:hypothetical protein Pcinc_039763 [Petrolisthes cinctipes]